MEVNAIFGPPGTGKTRTLVDIAVREQQHARGVLYLSYTKAAAAEAISRTRDHGRIKPSTLHSFAFSALGMNRTAVVDWKKKAEFAKLSGIPFQASEKGSDEPQEGDEYATVLEYAHNRIIDPMEAWEQFGRPGTQHRFEMFVTEYESWKKTYGFMDYDDMLTKFAEAPHINRSAEVVILDEAQDCTPLQWQAFIRICDNAKRVYVAGDDDQAIYEWSGADPHGMFKFADENGGNIRVLDQSYRVPRLAHDFVHREILEFMADRHPKEFRPRAEEGRIVRHGDLIHDIDFRRFAKDGAMVLVRDKFRAEEVKRTLNQMGLPYDVLGGFSPWTSSTANAIRNGEKPEIPPQQHRFYAHVFDPKAKITLQLSTVHQAKGREHHTVIADLTCPTRVLVNFATNPDAERRVWYVALTRTSDKLILCGENPVI